MCWTTTEKTTTALKPLTLATWTQEFECKTNPRRASQTHRVRKAPHCASGSQTETAKADPKSYSPSLQVDELDSSRSKLIAGSANFIAATRHMFLNRLEWKYSGWNHRSVPKPIGTRNPKCYCLLKHRIVHVCCNSPPELLPEG